MAFINYLDFENEPNEKHTSLDRQLVREQKEYKKHYNPIKDKWRYKLIDKKTDKYYRFTRISKITKDTTFIDQFNGKYKYEPWPYKKYSPRKIIWVLILVWRNRLDLLNSVFNSKITNELWIIFRSVIVLLIAYTIWALFGEQLLEIIKKY